MTITGEYAPSPTDWVREQVEKYGGSEANTLRVPFSTDQLGWGTLVTGLVVLFGTLLVAMLGGAVGHLYQNRVDRVLHD